MEGASAWHKKELERKSSVPQRERVRGTRRSWSLSLAELERKSSVPQRERVRES